jgi:hypothetical protein
MSFETMPSADIVDLRVEQDTYQGQPQHDTQPGVDLQRWGSIVASFQGDPATVDANGNVWRGREAQREISPRAEQFLQDYYKSLLRQIVVVDSEARGWRFW